MSTAPVTGAQHWAAPCERARRLRLKNRAGRSLRGATRREIFALLAREGRGKTPMDALAELREAVNFLRYYAARAPETGAFRRAGAFACISPWNFPLANLHRPDRRRAGRRPTPCSRNRRRPPRSSPRGPRAAFLHEAGVPRAALQLLPGTGAEGRRGADLSSRRRRRRLHRLDRHRAGHSIARWPPISQSDATLIAETGGAEREWWSTAPALPEQAVPRHHRLGLPVGGPEIARR